MLLNKASFATKETMSKDPHKYALNGILINDKETISTDTHIMGIVEHPKNQDISDFPFETENNFDNECETLVPASAIKKIESNIPKSKTQDILNNTFVHSNEQETVSFTTDDLDTENTIKTRKLAGTFPDYNMAMGFNQDSFESGYNIKNLEKLVKFFKSAGIKDQRIQFNFSYNENHGVGNTLIATATLKHTDQKCTCVVMPFRKP